MRCMVNILMLFVMVVFGCSMTMQAERVVRYGEVVAATGKKADANAADWIGIMATRINAQLLKACFGDYCKNDVVYNPTVEDLSFDGQVLVASGWKPGFSTDTDAVYLGEKFDGKVIVNLSNIEKVYTDDPRKNPDAKPLDNISWEDFRKMVGAEGEVIHQSVVILFLKKCGTTLRCATL